MSKYHYYTDEKNAQILISLLKNHGIRKVIANPGTTNIAVTGSIQNDPWFEVFSGIDERHSAYMAVGMAAESGKPVVLSCTGATASRNYLPALTEAYYRKLPILAVTSMQCLDNIGQLSPQAIDRSQPPKDAVRKSFTLRTIRTPQDELVCIRNVNAAIQELYRHGGGPVHINLEMGGCMSFNTKKLPDIPIVHYHAMDDVSKFPELSIDTKIVLYLGAGQGSSNWSNFAASHNCAVFADQSVDYCGPNRVGAALLCQQTGFSMNPRYAHLKPDLIISAGEVSGDYPVLRYLSNLAPVWRVSPDGEIRSPFGLPDRVFEMSSSFFSAHYSRQDFQCNFESTFAKAWRICDAKLRQEVPELPFSNLWIAQQLSKSIPEDSVLHLGILNSLRVWNFFPAIPTIHTYSNVGGFGIDGGLSTIIGSSLISPQKLHFGVFGDLAFFYDLNALGNRHIRKNIRILVVNNGCGTEFNMYFHPGSQFDEKTNDYIAAGGHFGNKSKDLVKNFTTNLGFEYLSANNKADFSKAAERFISLEEKSAFVFEVFTESKCESDAINLISNLDTFSPAPMNSIRQLVPGRIKAAAKALLNK